MRDGTLSQLSQCHRQHRMWCHVCHVVSGVVAVVRTVPSRSKRGRNIRVVICWSDFLFGPKLACARALTFSCGIDLHDTLDRSEAADRGDHDSFIPESNVEHCRRLLALKFKIYVLSYIGRSEDKSEADQAESQRKRRPLASPW